MGVLFREDVFVMDLEIKDIGDLGEKIAGQYLKDKGYSILSNHYTTRWGEIDLVVQDQEEIVFVEVKSRSNQQFGMPTESITEQKLNRLIKTIHCYLQEKCFNEASYRIDVISIIFSSVTPPAIQHLKNITPFPELNYPKNYDQDSHCTVNSQG